MEPQKIQLQVREDDGDVAYLSLPDHPGPGTKNAVAKQVRLANLLTYVGADIFLDLDSQGRLIGIEIQV